MAALTEESIRRLLAADPVLRGKLRWKPRGVRVRARMEVDNAMGEPMTIEMHISTQNPSSYSIALMWDRRPIKRLDVRGRHTNVCDGSGKRWRWQTHKHPFTDQYQLAQAYTPEDIPQTPGFEVGREEYREVFEAFCQECNIRLEYDWSDPSFDGEQLAL
jgi:hypothetical protein